MLVDDHPLRQSLRPRGAEIVLASDLDQARPHQPDVESQVARGQRERRQRQVVEHVERAAGRAQPEEHAAHALRRKEVELERQSHEKELAQPEDGQRVADEAHDHERVIRRAARPPAARDAETDAGHGRDGEG